MTEVKVLEVSDSSSATTPTTEAPIKKVKAEADLALTPAQIERLIRSKQGAR